MEQVNGHFPCPLVFRLRLVHCLAGSPGYARGIQAGGQSGARVEPESDEQLLRKRLLVILAEKPLGKGEISAKLGQKTVSGPLNRLIRQLIKEGVIEMTIPAKPNSRLQKYRLVTG